MKPARVTECGQQYERKVDSYEDGSGDFPPFIYVLEQSTHHHYSTKWNVTDCFQPALVIQVISSIIGIQK